MPQSVSDRVNQFIANTDAPEFTARNIADAIGVTGVNIVSAALSKLKSDNKIAYRVIPHEKWGRPIHMYLNPRNKDAQAPIVIPPRPVRVGKRELVNPGCTAIVDGWIEKKLGGREDGFQFTSTIITGQTGVNINRVSALLNALRYKHRIRVVDRNGCQNIYFTTKKMFHSYKRRRKSPVVPVVLAPRPEVAVLADKKGKYEASLVSNYLFEGAVEIERNGLSRNICVNLITYIVNHMCYT
jgi:hypothetical protein